MPKEQKTKHTLWLRAGDVAALQDAFPKQGASAIIRATISNLVDKINRPLSAEEQAELKDL